jgi:hypothetical protein
VDPSTTTGKKRRLGVEGQEAQEADAYNNALEGPDSDVGLFCDFWKTLCLFNNDWIATHAAHLQKTKKGYVAGMSFARFLDEEMQHRDAEELLTRASDERHRDLVKHPIYILLGMVISKEGFGFDLTRFNDSEKFKRMITPRFLARILFACIKSGKRSYND